MAEGKVPGPRILCVGAILSPTGGHGQAYGYRQDVCTCVQSGVGVCDGVDGCRRAVRLQVAQGADAIKFAATGGVLSNIRAGVDQQFTTDELRTIIETAHMLGRRVSAHAHGTGGINAALENGVDSIEHGSFLDDESIRLFLRNNAFHTPTIIAGATVLGMAQGGVVLTPAQREKALVVGEQIKLALGETYRAGVKISFGTDMGVGPHGENAREFALMVEAGMSAADAIKAATVTASRTARPVRHGRRHRARQVSRHHRRRRRSAGGRDRAGAGEVRDGGRVAGARRRLMAAPAAQSLFDQGLALHQAGRTGEGEGPL
ncbi:MAG: amidohydrolase family protein [Caulobacteraceae bacterium]